MDISSQEKIVLRLIFLEMMRNYAFAKLVSIYKLIYGFI